MSEETLCEEPEINGNDKMHLMSSTVKMFLTNYFPSIIFSKSFLVVNSAINIDLLCCWYEHLRENFDIQKRKGITYAKHP